MYDKPIAMIENVSVDIIARLCAQTCTRNCYALWIASLFCRASPLFTELTSNIKVKREPDSLPLILALILRQSLDSSIQRIA